MSKVFISYTHQDELVADQLIKQLRDKGLTGLQIINDTELLLGDNWTKKIENDLRQSETVVILLSKNSNRSDYVKEGIRYALESEKRIIPVLLDEEGTNNWIWPLVSDRIALKLTSDDQIGEVVEKINHVIGRSQIHSDTSDSSKPSPMPSLTTSKYSFMLMFLAFILGMFAAAIAAFIFK